MPHFSEELIPFCKLLLETDYFSCCDQTDAVRFETECKPERVERNKSLFDSKDDPSSPLYLFAEQDEFSYDIFNDRWDYATITGQAIGDYMVNPFISVRGNSQEIYVPVMYVMASDRDSNYKDIKSVSIIVDDKLYEITFLQIGAPIFFVNEGKQLLLDLADAEDIAMRLMLADGEKITIDPFDMDKANESFIKFAKVFVDAKAYDKISESTYQDMDKTYRETCTISVRSIGNSSSASPNTQGESSVSSIPVQNMEVVSEVDKLCQEGRYKDALEIILSNGNYSSDEREALSYFATYYPEIRKGTAYDFSVMRDSSSSAYKSAVYIEKHYKGSTNRIIKQIYNVTEAVLYVSIDDILDQGFYAQGVSFAGQVESTYDGPFSNEILHLAYYINPTNELEELNDKTTGNAGTYDSTLIAPYAEMYDIYEDVDTGYAFISAQSPIDEISFSHKHSNEEKSTIRSTFLVSDYGGKTCNTSMVTTILYRAEKPLNIRSVTFDYEGKLYTFSVDCNAQEFGTGISETVIISHAMNNKEFYVQVAAAALGHFNEIYYQDKQTPYPVMKGILHGMDEDIAFDVPQGFWDDLALVSYLMVLTDGTPFAGEGTPCSIT